MKNLYFALKDGKHGNREKYFLSTNKILLTTKQMYSIYKYSSELGVRIKKRE